LLRASEDEPALAGLEVDHEPLQLIRGDENPLRLDHQRRRAPLLAQRRQQDGERRRLDGGQRDGRHQQPCRQAAPHAHASNTGLFLAEGTVGKHLHIMLPHCTSSGGGCD
jgi:hypothetical protein